jgi:hypothetical protein
VTTSRHTPGFPEHGISTAIEALAADRQGQLLDEASRRHRVGSARAAPWRRALGHGLVRLGQRMVGREADAAGLAGEGLRTSPC